MQWFGATHAVKGAERKCPVDILSERPGRSQKRQNLVLTNRNDIWGYRTGISNHIIVTSQTAKEKRSIVDVAGIGGRNRAIASSRTQLKIIKKMWVKLRLPEEVSMSTSWQMEKSAEVIVGIWQYRTKDNIAGVERTDKPELSNRERCTKGLNAILYLMSDGSKY